MKKLINLLILMFLSFGLTGCVKYHISMEVSNDKSVTLEIIHGVNITQLGGLGGSEDDSMEDEDNSLGQDPFEENLDTGIDYDEYDKFKSKGFKVEKYTEQVDEGIIEGVKLTKTYPNIDDISTDKEITIMFEERFNSENVDTFDDSVYFTKNGNKYSAKFTFNLGTEEGNTSMYDDVFDLQYKIQLPDKSISNNATSVSEDGKELIWDLKFGKENLINFEFTLGDNSVPVILIISVLFFISSCCVLGFVIYKANKTKKLFKSINE